MKALHSSALLIALLSVAEPVGAYSHIHLGTLAADQPYTINIDAGGIPQGKTVLTLYYLTEGTEGTAEKPGRLGKATKPGVLVFAAGTRGEVFQVVPKGKRVAVADVAPPRGGTVNVDVTQGLTSYQQSCVDGCTLVLDFE